MHATWGSPTDFALNPNKQGLKNFERILKVAKTHNVKIAIENVDCYSIKHGYYLRDNIKDKSVGFCYDSLIEKSVLTEKHDRKVDYIITEKGIMRTNG